MTFSAQIKMKTLRNRKPLRSPSYLRFPRVLVGLDEDLADADVFANGPQSWLHGLPGSQDGHACDLKKNRKKEVKKIK